MNRVWDHSLLDELLLFKKENFGSILITGATGFIGSQLFNLLSESDVQVFGIHSGKSNLERIPPRFQKNIFKINLNDKQKLAELFSTRNISIVVHAATYGSRPFETDTKQIWSTNFFDSIQFMNLCDQFNVHKFVSLGSSSEYGLNSTFSNECTPLEPNSIYSESKGKFSAHLAKTSPELDLQSCHLRLYSVYGPGEAMDRVIPRLIHFGLKGQYPPLSKPKTSRDFVFIDDVLRAILLMIRSLKSEHDGHAFNICTGKNTSLQELALMAKQVHNINPSPVFETASARGWDLDSWYGNGGKIKSLYGFEPIIELEQGYIRTLKCFENYE